MHYITSNAIISGKFTVIFLIPVIINLRYIRLLTLALDQCFYDIIKVSIGSFLNSATFHFFNPFLQSVLKNRFVFPQRKRSQKTVGEQHLS